MLLVALGGLAAVSDGARPAPTRMPAAISARQLGPAGSAGVMALSTVAIRTNRGAAGPDITPPDQHTLDRTLTPGASQPVDLMLHNPHDQPLTIANLSLRVRDVDAPSASVLAPCAITDFFTVEPSRPDTLTLPPATTTSLSTLGIPATRWPRVGMHNTPLNQDGCKGATARFAVEASEHAPRG